MPTSDDRSPDTPIAPEDFERAVAVLRAIDTDRGVLVALTPQQRTELLQLAGQITKPDRKALRKMAKAFRRADRAAAQAEDRELIEKTGLRVQRRAPVYEPLWLPPPSAEEAAPVAIAPRPALNTSRNCYVCKTEYTTPHRYYDSMCAPCGDFNYAKREQTADLAGRCALVTGARVKIGYQAALKLLRAGAQVIVTTRFPVDAAARYAREPDYADFRERLQVYGLDLRHTPSVEIFARSLAERLPRLDYILNNACQTVRRPAGWFRHLLELESQPFESLPAEWRGTLAAHADIFGNCPAARPLIPFWGSRRCRMVRASLRGSTECTPMRARPRWPMASRDPIRTRNQGNSRTIDSCTGSISSAVTPSAAPVAWRAPPCSRCCGPSRCVLHWHCACSSPPSCARGPA